MLKDLCEKVNKEGHPTSQTSRTNNKQVISTFNFGYLCLTLKKEPNVKSSVDSRNFEKWGRSPTTAQNVGEGLKNLGDNFMISLMKNTFLFI